MLPEQKLIWNLFPHSPMNSALLGFYIIWILFLILIMAVVFWVSLSRILIGMLEL